jgi:hypothetical protein
MTPEEINIILRWRRLDTPSRVVVLDTLDRVYDRAAQAGRLDRNERGKPYLDQRYPYLDAPLPDDYPPVFRL